MTRALWSYAEREAVEKFLAANQSKAITRSLAEEFINGHTSVLQSCHRKAPAVLSFIRRIQVAPPRKRLASAIERFSSLHKKLETRHKVVLDLMKELKIRAEGAKAENAS